MIIARYGTDSSLVAVNTDGTLYTGTGEIREYRYSGATANNYVIFNDDGDGATEANELWRIVGVFKNSNNEWNLKLMRDNTLGSDELPSGYTINGTTFEIAESSSAWGYYEPTTDMLPGSFLTNEVIRLAALTTPGTSIWNSTSVTNINDWTTAGLQYFLNTVSDTNGIAGYYSTFTTEAKALIDENYTYNLGNVNYKATTLEAYIAERETTICASTVIVNSNNNSCDIWYNNQPEWKGAIGLLYSSDYGYSADSSYWGGTTLSNYENAAYAASWMSQTANHSTSEWLLSPSDEGIAQVTSWFSSSSISSDFPNLFMRSVRPVLNLISGATMDDEHTGDINDPYVIIE